METDWIFGALGGGMIGLAAAIYLLVNGRIMGASGILGGLVTGGTAIRERLALTAGLVLVPAVIVLIRGGADTGLTQNVPIIILAGLAVGIGTRLANGCTSGHGVCGISRLSPRGIMATLVYLLAGALTVALARALWGLI